MKKLSICSLLFIVITSFFISNISYSQDSIFVAAKSNYNKSVFRELFVEGNLMMIEKFNDTAIKTFLVLHEMDPTNANVNFKIGQLYLASSSQKTLAVKYLEAAVSKASSKYTPDEPSEKRCPELVYKLLGQAYHLSYRFDEAIAMFEKFSTYINKKNLSEMNDIKRRIQICKNAKIFVNSPIKCTITNLGDSVNSDKPDYGAVITADESAIYFTSRRFNSATGGNDNRDIYDNYYEDIWVSYKKEDSTWTEAKPLSTHVNSWYNEAVIGISADGQQLLLYKNDKGGSIYYSKLEGDEWSYAYMLGTDPADITDINSPSFEPSACFSADGNTLYFVSDRPGGFGGRDIYKCVKLPTGRWSKATNLGPTINSEYDEDAPFMHPDGATMFFSSNGHNTMGGFDIYFTSLGDSGWFPPQNMGFPINTPDDDIFYVMSTDGKRAYFSSLRQEGKGEKDLYMITIPQRVVIPVTLMKGYISFLGKDTLMSYVTISATDLETGNIVQEVHPNSRTLKYILPLNPGRYGKKYSLSFEAEGFRPYTEIVSVSAEGEYKEIDKNFDFKNTGSITVFGNVKNRAGESIKGVKISAKDPKNKSLLGLYATKENGTYNFDLPGFGGESYSVVYESEGYLPMTEQLTLPTPVTVFDFQKDITMEKPDMLGSISVKGILTDKEELPIKNSKVIVTDNKSGEVAGTYSPKNNGEYYFNLPRGNNYNISYEAPGFLFQSENLNTPKEKSYSEITKNVSLTRIEKGAKVVLNNIFFDSGKSILRKESNVELDKLYELINSQLNMKIEVGGHTDNSGKDEINTKLSQERADAVVNYLIIKGADRLRLIAQGYGSAQPIAPNNINGKPNPQNMQLNRRVEFKILDN